MSSSRTDSEATVGDDGLSPPAPAAAPDQTLALPEPSQAGSVGDATLVQPLPAAARDSAATLEPLPASPDATIQHGRPAVEDLELALSSKAGVFVDPHTSDQLPSLANYPQVPGYEILGELGRGAMGVVYKARQVGLKRLVALKMILAGSHASPAELVRFRTEAEAIARLQHPNIVQVFEIGEHHGLPFFSLEFVEGGSLASQLTENTMPTQQAAIIMRKLAEGMTCAHEHGIVHRDLKPANVLLSREGEPKITDFGLAKKLGDDSGATRVGSIMGTPSYMAPEQAEGRIDLVGPHSDIYALGAILYDLITGRPPFRGASVLETLTQVRTVEPVSPTRLHPTMPRDLETICLKCLQKDPQKRYHTARDLAEDLRRFLAGEPILARPVSSLERAWKWCKRRPAAAALLAVSTLSLLLLAVGGVAIARVENRRAEEAVRLRDAADSERRRAEEHFRQAREAVDQMLLRVGQERLAYEPRMEQVRRDLLQKAAAFYDRFLAVEDPSPVVRQEAAQASRKVGDIHDFLGQTQEAEKSYRRSLELLESLALEHPDDATFQQDLAATCNQLGSLLRRLRRYSDAEPVYTRAIELQQKLADEEPDNSGRRRELARTHYNRALLEEARGQPVPAILSCRTALKLYQKLAADAPHDAEAQQELARTWMVLGRLQAGSHPDDAERSLQEALTLLEQMVKDSPTPPLRQELMLAANQMGDLLRNTRPREAGPLFRLAVTLGEGLVSDFPTVPDYQQELAASCNNLAVWNLAAGRREEARRVFERGLALKERLAGNFPRQPDYRRELARTLGNFGLFEQTAGRSAAAELFHRRSVEHLRQLIKESPGNLADERELALALVRLATVDAAGAEKELREALAIQERLVQRDRKASDPLAERARTASILATMLLARGKHAEAEKLQQQSEANFRDLIKRFPDEPDYVLSLGASLINRGELCRVNRRTKEAEQAWREAVTLLGELTRKWPRQPTYAREQAKALHNLGVLLTADKRLTEAEAQHRQALAIRQKLIEQLPDESAYRQELAGSLAELAIVLAYRNRLDSAVEQFTKAITLLDKLHQDHPQELGYIQDLITQHGNLANLFRALGRDDDAIRHWQKRIALLELLAKQTPMSADRLSDVGRALHELAMQLVGFRRLAQAREGFARAIEKQRQALKLAPESETARALLCAHYLGQAEAYLAEKDHAQAARAVGDVLPEVPAKWNQYPVAAALLARSVPLAMSDTKLAEMKRKEIAKGYEDRAIELLRKGWAAGFRDAQALRTAKEFEPLREHAEFKKLLTEMEKK